MAFCCYYVRNGGRHDKGAWADEILRNIFHILKKTIFRIVGRFFDSWMMKKSIISLKNVRKKVASTCAGFSSLSFVPKHEPAKEEELRALKKFIDSSRSLCVLSGAGVSTESGIPDYRSAGVGLYATSDKRPVLYKDFTSSESVRRRYWARNYVAWPRFSAFRPNATHFILRHLESRQIVGAVVTQNVDRLHQKAGHRNVIELHGSGFVVVCLGCEGRIDRFDFQKILDELNGTITAVEQTIRPDGDVELTQEQVDDFRVPACSNCRGILKPDIVFFGDNVGREKVEKVRATMERSDALLVLGSSIATYSGYRIVLQAVEARKPIAVVNIGDSRADKHADLKIASRCGDVLTNLFPAPARR